MLKKRDLKRENINKWHNASFQTENYLKLQSSYIKWHSLAWVIHAQYVCVIISLDNNNTGVFPGAIWYQIYTFNKKLCWKELNVDFMALVSLHNWQPGFGTFYVVLESVLFTWSIEKLPLIWQFISSTHLWRYTSTPHENNYLNNPRWW